MSGSVQQIERMLALVPYLRSNEGVQVAEVADLFGVSRAQIVKDLNVLWFCGLPEAVTGEMIDVDMDALESDGVVFIDNADFLARPLRLNAYEAASLITALLALRETVPGPQLDALDSALAKLRTAVGDLSAAPARVYVEEGAAEVREQVTQAIRDGRRLHLRYLVESRDERTERDVDPLRIITAGGRLYLEGWCYRANAVRLFRLDRIEALETLDVPVATHPEVPERPTGPHLFQPGPGAAEAVLALHPNASWVREYVDHTVVGEDERGWTLIRVLAGDETWLKRFVLRGAGSVRVVEPASLAESVASDAAVALAAYDSP